MTAPQGEAQKDPAGGAVLDVVVVGESQAALAMAWHLAQQGLRFVVLAAAPEVGQVWRSRWGGPQRHDRQQSASNYASQRHTRHRVAPMPSAY